VLVRVLEFVVEMYLLCDICMLGYLANLCSAGCFLFSLSPQAFCIVALFSGRIRPSLNEIRSGFRAYFDAGISFGRLKVAFKYLLKVPYTLPHFLRSSFRIVFNCKTGVFVFWGCYGQNSGW